MFQRRTREVLLMSMLHRDATVSTKEDKKPNVLIDYIKFKAESTTLTIYCTFSSFMRFCTFIHVKDCILCKTFIVSFVLFMVRWAVVVVHNIWNVSAYYALAVCMGIGIQPGKEGNPSRRNSS